MTRVTQAHIEARTSDILEAATHLFATQGIEATTMHDIATEAGISAGAIYRYFASKEELLRAVFGDCTQEKRAWFQAAASNTETPLHALLRVGRNAWDELHEYRPEHLVLGLEATLAAARRPESVPAEHRESELAVVEMLEDLIRQAQAAGEIDPALDARALALLLQACHIGCHVLQLDLGEGTDLDPVFDVLADLLGRLAPAGQLAFATGREEQHDVSHY
jgi:AcrR family transcriptional regulator